MVLNLPQLTGEIMPEPVSDTLISDIITYCTSNPDDNQRFFMLNALLGNRSITQIVPPVGAIFITHPETIPRITELAQKIIQEYKQHNTKIHLGVNKILGDRRAKICEIIDTAQVRQACEEAQTSPIHESQYSFDKKPFPIRYSPATGTSAESWNIDYQKDDGSIGTQSYPTILEVLGLNGITSKAQKIKPQTIEKNFEKEIKEGELSAFLDEIGNTAQKEGTYTYNGTSYKITTSGSDLVAALPDGTTITKPKNEVMHAILTVTEPPIFQDFGESITATGMLTLLTQIQGSRKQKGSYKFGDNTFTISDGGKKVGYLIPAQRGWFGKVIPEKKGILQGTNLDALAHKLEEISKIPPYVKKSKIKKEKPAKPEEESENSEETPSEEPEEKKEEEKEHKKASKIKRFLWTPEWIEHIETPVVRGLSKAGYRMIMTGVVLGAASIGGGIGTTAMITNGMATAWGGSLTWSFGNWFNKKYVDKKKDDHRDEHKK